MKASLRLIGNFVLLFLLVSVLFSFAMFQGDFVSWFLFFSFLPIFLYYIGMLLYPIKGWKVSRKLSHHIVHAGDSVSVNLKIKRAIPFPIYYCIVEEIFPHTLQKVDTRQEKYHHIDHPNQLQVNRKLKKVIFPWFKRVIEIPYTMEQMPRGVHQLQAIRIKAGDVFGFMKKERVFEVTDSLIAYPNERPIHIKEQFSNFAQGSISSHALNLKDTNIASGIREYVPGDKFASIDWKQTARRNMMMTKEFEQEKSTDTMIILDGCYYKGVNLLAFEAAIEVTISLMEAIHKQASQVGLLTIGEKSVHFPLHHERNKKESIHQHLTRIEPTGQRPFAVQLKEESFKLGSGSVIMIITNRLDEPLRQSVKELNQRTKRVIIFFIQSTISITQKEYQIITALQTAGIGVSILTEKQLVKNPIEVNVT